ncbi:hypothetical protein LCGC14_0616890 [marine sediment metagenome]|uniref:5'-3' exonuclease domain-containing protein n=1 Tax=marine sediment metagenome TaxID=412755 RepID=A0A0F9RQB6_9ZZZZ
MKLSDKVKAKNKNENYDLIVLDGKNLSFKYFYGMIKLTNDKGEKTGLYHGFLSAVLKLKIDNPGVRVVVAWEGGKLVRDEMLDEYKGDRKKKHDELLMAISKLKKMLGAIGIEQKYIPGYEADDVASCLCVSNLGKKTLLISTDSDWLQMMHEGCSIKVRDKVWTYSQLLKREGFPPERILIYNVLKGSHNNVKGIPFFPTDLARKLAKGSSCLEDLYASRPSDSVELKWIAYLCEHKSDVEFNYRIMKLRKKAKLEDIPCRKVSLAKLKEVLIKNQLFQVMKLMERVKA